MACIEKLEDRTLLVGAEGPDLVAFAQGLSNAGVTLFGGAACTACTQQKQLFEDGATVLPFVNVTNPDGTLNATGIAAGLNVNSLPTWEFQNGTRVNGVLTLAEISQQSGIAIPVSSGPTLMPIADVTLLSGSPLHIELDAYDPTGGTLTFTASSDSASVSTKVLQGNRSVRMSVRKYGDMVFQLFEQRASRVTDHFIELAQTNFFDGVIFHRVINNFVIQGGDPTGTGTGGSPLGDFDDQFNVELQHNRSGLLSTAKTFDDTNDSQFFVTGAPTRWLDFQHSIFGVLVEGDDVREAISKVPTTSSRPDTDVVIDTVEVFVDQENGVLMLSAPEGTSGNANITVTVTDEDGNSFQRIFHVTVQPDVDPLTDPKGFMNSAPFLADIPEIRTLADTAVTFQLTAIDAEGDSAPFLDETALLGNSLPLPRDANGNPITADPNVPYSVDFNTGLVTVTPRNGVSGVFPIVVATGVRPGPPGSAREAFIDYQVVPIHVDILPVANNDFETTEQNTPVVINVVGNDTDQDGSVDPATVAITTNPAQGAVQVNNDGTVTYTSANGFLGTESFAYRVLDNGGATSNEATATITVTPMGAIVVTTDQDTVAADGQVSLREAIQAANTDTAVNESPAGSGADVIAFHPRLFANGMATVTLGGSELSINNPLTISGPGRNLLTINGNNQSRIFNIDDNSTVTEFSVTISGVTLTGGSVDGDGGGVFNAEDLTIEDSTISASTAGTNNTPRVGGGIHNTGFLQIVNSTISGNTALGGGAGISNSNNSGVLSVTRSTITQNDATTVGSGGNGGGILSSGGTVFITDSTISDNNAHSAGGGIWYSVTDTGLLATGGLFIDGSTIIGNSTQAIGGQGGGLFLGSSEFVTISNSTIRENNAADAGGGIYNVEQFLTLDATTVVQNSANNGGGLFVGDSGTPGQFLDITNSTFSGNTATGLGGGIRIENIPAALWTISNSTIANNTANSGGGVSLGGGTLAADNTIFADNQGVTSAPDVSGTVNGNNNLVENTNGTTLLGLGHITGQDPLLRPLSDNGGPTQTHALQFGSPAVDAGTATNAPVVDQRGTVRPIDGNGSSSSEHDIGAFELDPMQLARFDLKLVATATQTNASGEAASLPGNLEFVNGWDSFFVEIWISTLDAQDAGVSLAQTTLNYNTTYFTATSVSYGSAFDETQVAAIDDASGQVTGISGTVSTPGAGDNQFVLFARVQFESVGTDNAAINSTGHHVTPYTDFNLTLSQAETDLYGIGPAAVALGPSPGTEIWPVMFDLNNDGQVDFSDLTFFGQVFLQNTNAQASDLVWAADFDHSGAVTFSDLTLFAANFRISRDSDPVIQFAANFPAAFRNGNLLAVGIAPTNSSPTGSLSVSATTPIVAEAQSRLSAARSQDQLLPGLNEITIRVVDLPDSVIGRATPDGVILLDDNAAGFGWFIDATPAADEEFGASSFQTELMASIGSSAVGRIDLLTVIMHELKHLAGFTDLTSAVQSHDLMSGQLPPGVRRLPRATSSGNTDSGSTEITKSKTLADGTGSQSTSNGSSAIPVVDNGNGPASGGFTSAESDISILFSQTNLSTRTGSTSRTSSATNTSRRPFDDKNSLDIQRGRDVNSQPIEINEIDQFFGAFASSAALNLPLFL